MLCADEERRRDDNHRQEFFYSFLHIKKQYISMVYKYVPRNCLITLRDAAVKGKNPSSQHLVFAQVIHIMFH
jgi:hypothetical protein